MLVALFGALALAAPAASGSSTVIEAKAATGVTAAAIEAATTPLKVLSFKKKKVEWTVSCKGPERSLTCIVTAPGKAAGQVVSGTANTLVVRIGGADWEIRVSGAPVTFDEINHPFEN